MDASSTRSIRTLVGEAHPSCWRSTRSTPASVASHEEFARAEGLTCSLLTDHRDGVGTAYGVALGGILRRAIFIIDGDGIIRWKHVAVIGFTYRRASEIREHILRLFPAPGGIAFAFAPPV